MPLLGSGNLAVRRDRFWEIGGFDEDFPVAGAEDQDFSIRARAAGALLLLDTNIRCLQNDNRLTLRDYCAREERSAETMPYLVRKYPSELSQLAYVRENRPIRTGDPPPLVLKKLVKLALAQEAVLEPLHRFVGLVEAAHGPERLLRRLYKMLLGIDLVPRVSAVMAGVEPQLSIVIVLHNSADELVDCPAIDRARDRNRVGRADRGRQRLARPQCRDRPGRIAAGDVADARPEPGFRRGSEPGAFPRGGPLLAAAQPRHCRLS